MKLLFAHPQRCPRKLARGEVQRIFARGPLLGYVVVCPGCGFFASYRHSYAQFVEGPWVEDLGLGARAFPERFEHPETLTAQALLECLGCGGAIHIVHNEITVTMQGQDAA
jgi:hypothetical protein